MSLHTLCTQCLTKGLLLSSLQQNQNFVQMFAWWNSRSISRFKEKIQFRKVEPPWISAGMKCSKLSLKNFYVALCRGDREEIFLQKREKNHFLLPLRHTKYTQATQIGYRLTLDRQIRAVKRSETRVARKLNQKCVSFFPHFFFLLASLVQIKGQKAARSK